MAIQWTTDLAVGVDAIDRQHRELFGIVNDLLEAMRVGRGRVETSRVLEFLQNYVVDHFGAEERKMVEVQYPGYRTHKAEHDGFIKDFLALKASHEAGGVSTALVIEINNRICAWLRNHIARTDRALGEYLSNRRLVD